MIELDHVLIAVADLESAGRALEARHGLTSVEGGRHPGWGTANRIVPLGATYVELIAVVDAVEASRSAFGSWIAEASPAPIGWAVRTDALDEAASRLSLGVSEGSRTTRDGRVLRWRVAGIAEAAAEPSLPFFLEWERGTPHPGRIPVAHSVADARIARLELEGDADRLAAWLGDHNLPIAVHPGAPRVAAVVVTGARGDVVLD